MALTGGGFQPEKDVISVNEMSSLSSLLESVQDFLLNWEGEPMRIGMLAINVQDKDGNHVGAITQWTTREDVKFEPMFKVEL